MLSLFERGSTDVLAHQQAKGECAWNLTKGVGIASSRLHLQEILGVLELFWRVAASSSFALLSLYPDKLSQTKSVVAGSCLLLRDLHIGKHYPDFLCSVLMKKKLRAASQTVGLSLSHVFSETVQCETVPTSEQEYHQHVSGQTHLPLLPNAHPSFLGPNLGLRTSPVLPLHPSPEVPGSCSGSY